jgi:hypothetical protein
MLPEASRERESAARADIGERSNLASLGQTRTIAAYLPLNNYSAPLAQEQMRFEEI